MKLGDGSRKKGKRSRRATKADNAQRYPWEATEPFWTNVKRGALDLPAFKVDARPSVQSVHLFVDVQEFMMLRARVAQAGVPTDLAGIPEDEIIRAITEAVGAKPDLSDETDLKASEAWVLVVFARIDFWMRRAIESGAAEDASRWGIMLGRCIELWRWLRLGHAAEAVSKQKQNVALPNARQQANRDRQFIAENWHDEAKAIADRIRERRPHLSKTALARLVLKELQAENRDFRRSVSTIRRVI